MMLRKDLLYAMLAGATLSGICCLLLLMPRHTAQTVPARETASTYKERPSAPPALAVVNAEAWNVAAPVSGKSAVPAVAVARPVKPAKTFKKPLLLPETLPTRKAVASRPPVATQEAPPVASLPVIQNSAPPAVAQVITAQEARVALGKVGTDPEAEAVWISAINDPNLPAKQRKDLIEDLNEEGFANPKQLTGADLPRIENRLALIEELAPEAIDQTNADAFQEAYKDLKSMQSRLSKP